MANSKKQCKWCRKYVKVTKGRQPPIGFFCNTEHMLKFAKQKTDEKFQKQLTKNKKMNKDFSKVVKLPKVQQKEYLRTRPEWYDKLQMVVNQWIVHVRDNGKSCCTCETIKQTVKYDAGHCFTRGARSELRFELTNIHIQCGYYCNMNNSGFQAKHKVFISEKYGADHLAKLEDRTAWPTLKEKFPHVDDIKVEILRWKVILRAAGLKPRT